MISRLSDPDCGVDEESFCTIMKYVKSEMRVNEICFDHDYIYAKGVPYLGKRNYSDIQNAFSLVLPSLTFHSLHLKVMPRKINSKAT